MSLGRFVLASAMGLGLAGAVGCVERPNALDIKTPEECWFYGGEWDFFGSGETFYDFKACNLKTRDFGKACIDGSECEGDCVSYRFSSCPDFCEANCISSYCSPDGICTADCEGPGSCICPGEVGICSEFVDTYGCMQRWREGAVREECVFLER